jgi:NHL repeat
VRAKSFEGACLGRSPLVSMLAALAMSIALIGSDAVGLSYARAALPSPIWEKCETGSEAGQCNIPRGIGADSESGHVFVADQENRRIVQFTAWGEFVRAWGWDVVATGPGDDTSLPEDEFEICVPGDGDICKSGTAGGGTGQFGGLAGPQGVAVDSEGSVYVVDRDNLRVQKFDAEGHFELMFGGDVNKTKVEAPGSTEEEQNLCPFDPGDVCQGGSEGTGNGQFGSWPLLGSFIAIGPADEIYVGDQDRIQQFDTSGIYQEDQVEVPGEAIQSLATDAAGNLYASYLLGDPFSSTSKADVHKFNPTGEPIGPSFEVGNPRAIAVDVLDSVYVFDSTKTEVLAFDADGDSEGGFAEDLSVSTGLVANHCEGSAPPGNIYVANSTSSPSFVRAYGTGPVGCEAPPPAPPSIEEQYAVAVGTDDALVRAKINPEFFSDTSYHVEYGTGSCSTGSCGERVPVSGESMLGGGVTNTGQSAQASLVGLSPGTTYHYRFVAKSSGGGPAFGVDPDGEGPAEASFAEGVEGAFSTPPLPAGLDEDCSNQVFRTGPSALLPDCRAFEMVSPLDKNGSGIETGPVSGGVLAALDQSAENGDGITYSSKQSFGEAGGAPWDSQYLSHRDPEDGWSTEPIAPPHEAFPGSTREPFDLEFKAFSDDLSYGWLIHQAKPPLDACAPENSPVLYRRSNENGAYEALHCEPNKPVIAAISIELLGMSADGCQAVFRSDSKLTADAGPAGPYQLYESNCEWPVSAEGPLRFVGQLPEGSPCNQESTVGSLLIDAEDAVNDGRGKGVWHAFSTDAHRLYWSCGTTLYLRTDPDLMADGDEEVVKVAAPTLSGTPRFQLASPDGARALFTNTGAGLDTVYRLLSYDAVAKTVTTVAMGVESNGKRRDLLGASEDATRAYLVSKDVLVAEPNSEGDSAKEGEPNLYLHQEGAGFTFIGTLSGDDLKSVRTTPSPVHPLRFRRASRVSPDGLHAAFISNAPLTGYDNVDAASGEVDAEVFVFDARANAGAGELHCVSCNPTGARPSGAEISRNDIGLPLENDTSVWSAAWIPGWQTSLYPGRPLSDDGTRLFFNSFEALVNRDTNNQQDVYEWQAAGGEDECADVGADLYVESAGGCLSLISSGRDSKDSEFVDADRDGSDVFIRTGESLLGEDPGLTDIYDARVEGGFPAPSPARPPCEGEACQSPSPPPSFGAPASAGSGPLNPKPGGSKCPKGKRKVRHGGKVKCVKRKAHRHHRRAQRKQGRAR